MGGILKTKQEKLFISKLIFTIYILVIYAIMRDVHLYGVDYAKMSESSIDAEMVLSQMVGGDIYKCSIVAVGLAPYMISSIIVMVLQLFKSDEAKARTSLKSINKFTIFITLVLTIAMASVRCNNLEFLYTGSMGVPFFRMIGGFSARSLSLSTVFFARRSLMMPMRVLAMAMKTKSMFL